MGRSKRNKNVHARKQARKEGGNTANSDLGSDEELIESPKRKQGTRNKRSYLSPEDTQASTQSSARPGEVIDVDQLPSSADSSIEVKTVDSNGDSADDSDVSDFADAPVRATKLNYTSNLPFPAPRRRRERRRPSKSNRQGKARQFASIPTATKRSNLRETMIRGQQRPPAKILLWAVLTPRQPRAPKRVGLPLRILLLCPARRRNQRHANWMSRNSFVCAGRTRARLRMRLPHRKRPQGRPRPVQRQVQLLRHLPRTPAATTCASLPIIRTSRAQTVAKDG